MKEQYINVPVVLSTLFNWFIYILNQSENATPDLFAIYIQNYANQECKWKCILIFKYCVMHKSNSFTDIVTRKHMKAI